MGERTIISLATADVQQRGKSVVACVNNSRNHLDAHISQGCRIQSILDIVERGSLHAVEQGGNIVAIMGTFEKAFRDDMNRLFVAGLDYSNSRDAVTLLNCIEQAAKESGKKIYLECGADEETYRLLEQLGYSIERVWIQKDVRNVTLRSANNAIRIFQLNSVLIREHFDELSDLYLINEHSHIYCESVTKEDTDEEIESLKEYINQNRAYAYGAFSEDNHIVGLAWAFPFLLEGDRRVNLRSITISPNYRGRNLASSLMNAVYVRVKDEGYDCMYTHFDKANTYAENFYQKDQWRIIGSQMVKQLVP